jgi:mRNA interferase HigB
VRIIKRATLQAFARKHPTAKAGLEHWEAVARKADWKNFNDVMATFRYADQIKVESGRTVVIFDIKRNDYRLITAVHYNRKMVFALDFLTHADYDKNKWKDRL